MEGLMQLAVLVVHVAWWALRAQEKEHLVKVSKEHAQRRYLPRRKNMRPFLPVWACSILQGPVRTVRCCSGFTNQSVRGC
jgi:hypothetical protein